MKKRPVTTTLDDDTIKVLKEVSKKASGEENVSLGIRLLAKKAKEATDGCN